MIAVFAIFYYGFILVLTLVAARWIHKSVFFAVAAAIAADFLFFEYFEHTPDNRQETLQEYKEGLIDRSRMYDQDKYRVDCTDNFVFIYNNKYCTSIFRDHYDDSCSNVILYYWPATPVIHRIFVNLFGFTWYGTSLGTVSTICENEQNN